MPIVSVVIAAFNAERTIRDAVMSALAQTESNIEIIVCDDGSSDGTFNIVSTISDPRVHLIHNLSNLGQGASRNRAIDAATGEWIAVLDSDDEWHSQRLEKLLQAIGAATNMMVFDDISICHDVGNRMHPWRPLRGPYAFGAEDGDPVDVIPAHWAHSSQFLIKPLIPTAMIRAHGVRHSNLRYGEDTEFFLRLIACGMRMRYLPEAHYLYRLTPGSMSTTPAKARLMRDMLASLLPLFDDDQDMQSALNRKILYRDFTMAIKSHDIAKAAGLAARSPSLLFELTSRGSMELAYAMHRKWHGGASHNLH